MENETKKIYYQLKPVLHPVFLTTVLVEWR